MQKPPKSTVILGSVLFLSLAGNLFMGGLMIGKSYNSPSGRVEWEKRENMLRKKLTKEDRDVLKKEMAGNAQKFKDLKKGLDDARKNVEKTMNAEPFDQAALDNALRVEKEQKMQLMTTMREAKNAAMEKLSPEGRQVMERMGKGGFGSWGDRKGPEGRGFEGVNNDDHPRPPPPDGGPEAGDGDRPPPPPDGGPDAEGDNRSPPPPPADGEVDRDDASPPPEFGDTPPPPRQP